MKVLRETIEPPSGLSFRIIKWERNLREVKVLSADGRFEKIAGEGVHWHHHPEMELTFFSKGKGTRFIGDHIELFEAGELVLIGKNLPHYWHTSSVSSGISIAWNFPDQHSFWGFPETVEFLELFRKAEKGIALTDDVARAISGTLTQMLGMKPALRLAKLMELFSMIAAAPDDSKRFLSTRSFVLNAGAYHQTAIAKAVKFVIANFRSEIRLDDLLRITGMSRPTFSRQFKEHAGRTLSEFVTELRLQAACRELLESDDTILDVSLRCGYNQISFFNRMFRRKKGCSPREYRLRNR